MPQDPLKSPDTAPTDKAIRPVKGDEAGEDQLDIKQPPQTPFSLKGEGAKTQQPQEQLSPMNLSTGSGIKNQGIPTPQDLTNQAQQIQTQMEAAKQQLQTPGLQFKPSTYDILAQHLNRVNDSMSVISSRLQLPKKPPTKPSSSGGVASLLDYLTGSQDELTQVSQAFKNPPPGGFQTSDLLAIQIKMGNVQVQVNFFTTLLGKALSNVQTIMNIQN